MKNSIHSLKNILTTERLFIRYFLQIFVAMAIIFAAFSVYTHRNSRRIVEKEFSNAGLQDLQNISGYVEDLIVETKDMIAALVVNNTLSFFYSSPTPENTFDNYSSQIKTLLTALRSSRECIEDIYLYSEASHTIISSGYHYYIDTFDDRHWLDQMTPDSNGFSIFPYAMKTRYPRVICVSKVFTVDNHLCAVAIMLNPAKIPIIASTNENDYQHTYIVSNDSKIIYR